MGIKNLLPFVKNACREGLINEIKGSSVAIDVSCLLHKGLFGSVELLMGGNDSKTYITYVKKHIQALLDIQCHVIMVFDGRPLPAKKDTNDGRRQKRADNMFAGKLLLSQGKQEEAISKFQQAISITTEIVETTIEFFRKMENVDIIVSPYESDAQLAFLAKQGYADAIITEDSDLIAFGCEKIIFKWNVDNGGCTMYERAFLSNCFKGEMRTNFDFTKFRRVCILSGCDYLQNGLYGIGLSKALKFFMKTAQTDLRLVLPRIPSYLQDSKFKISKSFIEDFIRAENTFLYQIVFDPIERCQRPLNPYPVLPKHTHEEDEDFVISSENVSPDYSYAGTILEAELSLRLALGNQICEENVIDKFKLPVAVPLWSIWCNSLLKRVGKQVCEVKDGKRKEAYHGNEVSKSGSPEKKRRAITDEKDYDCIILDDSSPKNIKLNTTPVAKKPVGRPRKIKNEPPLPESYEEIMKLYCSDKLKNDNTHLIKEIENINSDENKTSTVHISVSAKIINGESLNEQVQADVEVYSSHSPSVTGKSPFPTNPPNSGKKKLGTKPVLGKSPYFSARANSCSNPFKTPFISLSQPSDELPIVKGQDEAKNPMSLLSTVDDSEPTHPSPLTPNRFVGFKPPGLRRSITK